MADVLKDIVPAAIVAVKRNAPEEVGNLTLDSVEEVDDKKKFYLRSVRSEEREYLDKSNLKDWDNTWPHIEASPKEPNVTVERLYIEEQVLELLKGHGVN